MSATDELQRLCAEGGSYARIKYLRNKIKRATIAELRKLLRERGVRFNEFQFMTQWTGALGESVEAYPTDTFPDTLLVKHVCLTPEQAIAATLRSGTCRRLPADNFGTTCVVRGHGYEMEFGYWKCSECGTNCFDGARYCMNCGARVVDAC